MPSNILTATTDEQPVASLASVTTPNLLTADPASGIVASTNPVTSLQPMPTLFGQSGGSPLFQTASFGSAAH